MKIKMFDFQEDALVELRAKLSAARQHASVDDPQAVSFSAPTGAGKTIVMTALFENIFFGEAAFAAQPNAVILWISDMPELNEQTRLKIESKSERIRVGQLVNIDAGFDEEQLKGGHIYFMNTQKLGSEKLLTRKGDKRQYSIWETLTNTAKAIPYRFYVVIDEAHRGMRGGKAAEKAKTIMQRFLLGSPGDGLCQMPLVIGVSATPRRFEELLSGTTHTVHKVYVRPEDVRTSGLLKDRIVIHYPEVPGQEMSLLAEAANRWQAVEQAWATYCQSQSEAVVWPILVIQVEDGTDKVLTKTNLNTSLATLERAIGRRLREGEVAHTFNDSGDIDVDGHRVRRIEASRIEENHSIGVVLFKMSLSTGWDCPRAEVMMSFQRAQDHTYIAQLLGRMVRSPLARRVEADAALNDVHLFLPHYDQATVKSVIEDLKNVEDVPPTELGTSQELVTLYRRKGIEDVFDALSKLKTYRVNAVRKQSALRRLMGLGRALTHDQIDKDAQGSVKTQIVENMILEIQRLRDAGELGKRAKQITGIDLNIIAVEHRTNKIADDEGKYSIETASADIDRHFGQAGRLLGNGLEMDYWRSQDDREPDEVKVEVVVLAQDHEAMTRLETFASREFDALYEKYKRDIGELKEQRRQHFEHLRRASSLPQNEDWILPESIAFRRSQVASEYDKHLYLEDDDKFRADLGTWEREVLQEELANPEVIGWLRNVDRKPWSLEIPYEDGGDIRPMYPDLLVVRKDSKGFMFDILEPHHSSLKDNAAKAVGLAKFAEKHWNMFNRIQLIRKQNGADGVERYIRLDVGKDATRKKVLAVTTNNQLDQVFDELAMVSK